MGKMSKTKGKVGEREVARLLTEAGFPARRGQQFKGGGDSPDVVCDGLPGMHIEVKRTERFQLYPALTQAIADGDDLETPVVFHRSNGNEWVVVLRAADFLSIMKEKTHA